MKIKIKFTGLLGGFTINRKRVVSTALLLIAATVFFTARDWQPTVSGQELFGTPKFELPLPTNPALPGDMKIAYLSAEKDSQLNEKFDNLIAQADSKGSVSVIIGFRFDFKLDGNLTDSLIANQRAEIQQGQDAVLQKIESFAPENVKQFATIPYFAVTVDGATLRYLKLLPEITSVSEDELIAPTLAQSVPLVGAPTAWSNGYSGSGWTVAILDTGVNKAHTFLTGKVVSEACYSTTSSTTASLCPGGVAQSTANGSGYNCVDSVPGCDHGTHVAGIAAGTNASFSGVAKNADLISIQVFSRQDSNCGPDPAPCTSSFASDEILGLERVMALRNSFAIASVNMSLGIGTHSSTCDTLNPAETTAITNLRSVGIATIISSGNDSSSGGISFPACISTAVSVGSTGDGSGGAAVDVVSSFSNSSPTLKLLAPGQFINSSVPGGTYENKSGTSMAAPHVAGAWAILKQKFPNASVDTVLNALTATGLPVFDSRSSNPANQRFRPRIRIDAALRNLSGGTCGYSINPSGSSWGRGGGSATFAVNATESDCTWITSNIPSWITITSGASGVGDGVVGYSVAANTTAFTRTGTISVGGQTFTVTQLGDCVTAISPTSQSVGISGLNSSITVTATSGCVWTAQENASWITFIGQSSGTGSGVFSYSVAANSSGATRTANIIVGSKFMTVTQSGTFTTCTSSTPIAFGQTISGALTTSDCTIAGQPNRYADPYTFTGTAGQRIAVTMRGSGSFFALLYLIDPNGVITTTDSSGTSRLPAAGGSFFTLPVSGIYTIYATTSAGGVGTYSLILNDGATCGNSSISPSSQSFPVVGGSGSINLTINGGCAWETSRNFGWLTLTSGIAGTGSGAVNYTVQANSTGASRTQTIAVNGLPFIVTQSLQPTAAGVSISGRVLVPNGRGLSGAVVNLIDQNGETRSAYTNPFGYYRFNNIAAGQTVIVTVFSKQYEFAPQVLNVTEELNEVNFSAITLSVIQWYEATKENFLNARKFDCGFDNYKIELCNEFFLN